jgi:hypothetical protein
MALVNLEQEEAQLAHGKVFAAFISTINDEAAFQIHNAEAG